MNDAPTDHPLPHDNPSFREIITDAIRYWEPRRLLYNAVLAVVVIGYFLAGLPGASALLTLNSILFLAVLAVLANVCYCAAYLVDVIAQFSGFRAQWRRWRGLLLVLGLGFAGIITRFFALGFLLPFQAD